MLRRPLCPASLPAGRSLLGQSPVKVTHRFKRSQVRSARHQPRYFPMIALDYNVLSLNREAIEFGA